MSALARSLFLYIRFLMRSFFRLLKKDSTTASSQQFPLRLMLEVAADAAHVQQAIRSDAYFLAPLPPLR